MTIQKTLQRTSPPPTTRPQLYALGKKKMISGRKLPANPVFHALYWILYTIVVTAPAPLSQADLCEKWYFPRQTVNSAVKKLVSDGLVSLFTQKRIWKYQIPPAHTKGRRTCRSLCCPTGTGRHPLFFCFFQRRNAAFSWKLMQQQLTSLKEYSEQLWN